MAIAPVVVGKGRRLLPQGGAPVGLRLLRNETTPGGIAVHVYESAGPPKYGTYGASGRSPQSVETIGYDPMPHPPRAAEEPEIKE